MVIRWLRLVAADAELALYLIGIDRPRLATHLAAQLTAALGGPADARRPAGGVWRRFDLSEEQHWRVQGYLAAVLWVLDLPVDTIVRRSARWPNRDRTAQEHLFTPPLIPDFPVGLPSRNVFN